MRRRWDMPNPNPERKTENSDRMQCPSSWKALQSTNFPQVKNVRAQKEDSGERRPEKNGEWFFVAMRMRRVGEEKWWKDFAGVVLRRKSGGLLSRFKAVICCWCFCWLLRQVAKMLMMESWTFFPEQLSWEMKNVEDVDVMMFMCWTNALLSPENLNLNLLSVSDGFEKWWMLSTYPDSAETSCFVEKMNLLKRKTRKEGEDGWDVLMIESCRWSGKMVVAEMKKWLLMILMSKKRLLKNLMSKKWLLKNLLSRKLVVCSWCDEVEWSKSKKEENV
jgi:hypothetical protein